MTPQTQSEFANPFAEQSPFLLFYNLLNGDRMYQVDYQGCVTRDIFKATRYEINRYEKEVRFLGTLNPTAMYATIPICVYLPANGEAPAIYAGNQPIVPNSTCCRRSLNYQAACGAKSLARPLFRGGGPCGPVVQIGIDHGFGYTIAYFGIDLLFYPQGNASVPRVLTGFTRYRHNHFVSIPRYW